MGFGDKVKDIYFSAEEKWYDMLDKVDAHVPIYKVVDKIDQVVPSFALFIIVIIILLLLIGIGIFGLAGGVGGEAILQLTVVDNAGNGISGAEVTLQGIDETYYSNDFGLVEDITLPAGQTFNVTATKGDKTKSKQISLNESPKVAEIKLPVDQIRFDSMTALFLTETGQRITDRLNLSYTCTSGTGAPADDTIYDGSANINVASTCGVLSVNITSEKYETAIKTITTPSATFYLTEKIPAQMVTMSVQLKSGGTLITEPVTVKAFRMNNLYLAEDTVISANGTATFTLVEGNYKFSTITEQGYLTNSISNVAITNNMTPVVIDLTKSVIGKISVTAKRGSVQLEEVFITLLKGSIESHTGDTNEDGQIEFEVGEVGPYTIVATKEGYCSETKTGIAVGDSVNVAMTTDTGNCGGTLTVKVFDQDNKPVQYARAIIFGEKEDDAYKLGYVDKLTDYNGKAEWKPVKYSTTDEKYRVFAFKGSYTGWSTLRDFTAITQSEAFTIKLNIPLGTINVIVTDKDGNPITFADQEPVYVRLYEEYGNTAISGKKIIEDPNGVLSFVTKAGRRVYAVVEKVGYQSHMTLPKEVIGDGTITFKVELSRPPLDELYVNSLGLYKNGSPVLKVEPGQEYDAMFELVAPKDYEELGLYVRVGRDDYTKTEFDKIYIKEMIAPGRKEIMTGATYNPPKGYSTDEKYLNQDESKWAQVTWDQGGFVQGRIMASVKVKIKDNAQVEEQLIIHYRAWGVYEGSYERDITDDVLGSSASNSTKQELYAATKEIYTTVGMETLCEESGERVFCISSSYTDPDGLTSSFDTTFDAKNSSEYKLFLKVLNYSNVGFDIASIKLENDEENLRMGTYSLYTPTNQLKTGNVNGNSTEWIQANNFSKNSSITFNELKVTPTVTGYGSLKLRVRDASSILFEKTFGINIASNKKMRAEYMFSGSFQAEIPNIASGKVQTLTIKAKNNANGLEIDGAMVKLYDRFGTKLAEKVTNSLGTASITIPASLPSEKLTIKIEKADYETFVQDFSISEAIVEVTPTTLGFTVNPQTKTEDTKTIKIENQTGFELKIKEIKLVGKFKGKLNESQIESWLYSFTGTTISSDDYEEIELKIISATNVQTADDLSGKFQITVTNGYTEWVKEIEATIRVGLGKDADDPNCLAITQNSWTDNTQGEQISIGFEIMNNCTVDGTPIPILNLAAKDTGTGNILGTFSVQSDAAYTEVSRGFARTFQPDVSASEVVPVTLSFVPDGGVNGQTTGTIVFQAINETDSKDQVLQTSITYTIDAINLDDCVTIGADLIHITEGETGSFSVTNNCPTDVYFEVDTELMTSDDKFTLTSGETKEVSLTGEDDVIGAFNTLVYGREGSSTIELIDNVKTIIDPDGGCFSLSRYEFDIYDAPDDDYDGSDTAVLKNNCTEKSATANVEGTEDYDTDNLLQAATLGALAGLVGCGTNQGWSLACILGGSASDNNDKSERLSNATDSPTRTAGNQNTEPTLDRARTNAEKEMKDRATREATSLIEAAETDRLPGNLLKDVNEFKNEAIAALETQKDRLYQRKSLLGFIGHNIKKGIGGIGRFFGGAANLVSQVWQKEKLSQTKADKEEALTVTEDALVQRIDDRIDKINESYSAIAEAKSTFDDAIIAANSTTQAELTSKSQEVLAQRRAGGMASESEIKDAFNQQNDKSAKLLAEKYETASKTFKESAKKELDKLMIEVNGNLEDVAGFKEEITKIQEELQNSATAAQTAASLNSNGDLNIEQLRAEKAKLKTDYEKDKTELNINIKATENSISKNKALQKIFESQLTKAQAKLSELIPTQDEYTKTSNLINRLAGTATHTGDIEKVKISLAGGTITKEDGSEISYPKGLNQILEDQKQALTDLDTNYKKADKAYDRAIAATAKAEEKAKEYTTIMLGIIGEEIGKMTEIKTKLQSIIDSPATTKVDEKVQTDTGALTPEQTSVASPADTDTSTTAGENLTDLQKSEKITCESNQFNGSYYPHNKDALNTTAVCPTGTTKIMGTRQGECCKADNPADSENNTPYNWKTNLTPSEATIKDYYLTTLSRKNITYNLNGTLITVTSTDTGGSNSRTDTYTWVNNEWVLQTPNAAQFILSSSGSDSADSQSSSSGSSGLLNQYTSQIIGGVAAWNSGSLLGGALLGALVELTQASDTLVDEDYTFTVDYVTVDDISLESADGVALDVGETTYDYDDYYTSTSGGSGYNVASETLATTYQLVEETELTFTNPSGITSDTPYEPLVGILTVSASENVYADEYDYETIREAAIAREDYEENDAKWYEFWDVSETEIADMEEEDLVVDEVRTIEKEFHLLFNSYEYTTTIEPVVLGNCTVGPKFGSTGPDAVPKVKFNWDWEQLDVDTCDESNSDYVYCDTTQLTTTILKKVHALREFFRTTTLSECPQAIDVSGTKTQTLSEIDLDVGITQVQANETSNGAQLEFIVSTNNNLPMDIDLDVKVYQGGTTNVKVECNETQNVTSTATFYCAVDTTTAGSGSFDVVATISPTLCTGCDNSDSTNDVMTSQLIIGQSGTQDCLYYKTTKDYFEDVLAANGKLGATVTNGDKVLDYLNFTVNLVRDGFSRDFKEDFHSYLNTFTEKPVAYTDLEGLFRSNKFVLGPSGKFGDWEAGKYNARIVIEFEEDNWTWNDDNDIKSINIILSGWQKPDVSQAIYDIGFNGLVGLYSDTGRNGYGASYNQISEDALTIVSGIEATHNPGSNALSEVNVDVDKDFYTMNTSRRGNVLTIKRAGDKVDLILSPNTAVPLILDVTRTSARDAYAFYKVEVDGEPQSTGSSLITWNGIGNGCVDFDGSGMGTWDNAPDTRESSGNGYGIGGSVWTNAVASGTASFYGTFYAPDDSSTVIYFTRQSEDASFISSQGTGDLLTIDTSSGVSSLKTVFDKVENEEICVIGGEYYWNSKKVYEPIEAKIISRSDSCMQIG